MKYLGTAQPRFADRRKRPLVMKLWRKQSGGRGSRPRPERHLIAAGWRYRHDRPVRAAIQAGLAERPAVTGTRSIAVETDGGPLSMRSGYVPGRRCRANR